MKNLYILRGVKNIINDCIVMIMFHYYLMYLCIY